MSDRCLGKKAIVDDTGNSFLPLKQPSHETDTGSLNYNFPNVLFSQHGKMTFNSNILVKEKHLNYIRLRCLYLFDNF